MKYDENTPKHRHVNITNTDVTTVAEAQAQETIYVTDIIVSATGGAVTCTIALGGTTVAVLRIPEDDTRFFSVQTPIITGLDDDLTAQIDANEVDLTMCGYVA